MNVNAAHVKSKIKESLDVVWRYISKLEARLEGIESTIKCLGADSLSGDLQAAKADAKTIHDNYQTLLLKQVVASEVAYTLRVSRSKYLDRVCATILRAYDNPDGWWLDRKSLTIGEWTDEFKKLMRSHTAGDKQDKASRGRQQKAA